MLNNSQAVAAGEMPVPPAFLAHCEASTLWGILTHATGNRVSVFDAAGRVVYANAMVNAEFAPRIGRASVVGLAVQEYTPPECGDEWQGFIRRAMQGRRPLVVEGMVHGKKYRATLTPVGDAETGYVLVVSRNAADVAANDPGPGAEVIQAKANDLGVLAGLTDREMEVLELIGDGLSTAEVAGRLDRSVKTVEWHRAALGSKLGITNRVELARIAIAAGLCRPGTRNGRKHTARATPEKTPN